MAQPPEGIQEELTRRHRASVMVVAGLFVLTLILLAIAYVSKRFIPPQNNPSLDMAWRIAIPMFGLGAVVLRRTKFAAMRLQDIAGLRGTSGLLATLQGTTIQVALLGGAIAVMGFVIMVLTGIYFYMLGAGIVAIAVLLYCYPRRIAWQRVVQGIQQAGDADAPSAKGRIA